MSRVHITEEEEDALYNMMKELPDFLSFPIPAKWFKKYNIPPIEAGGTKEFIESNHPYKMMYAPKDLPPIIINEPQKDLSGNIKLYKMVEPEKVDVSVVSRPYDPDAMPLPLETLSLEEIKDLSGVVVSEPTTSSLEHS